jgi:hypothetical protein
VRMLAAAQTPLDVLPAGAVLVMAAFLCLAVIAAIMIVTHFAADWLGIDVIASREVDTILFRCAVGSVIGMVGCLAFLAAWGAVAMVASVT